MPGSIPIVYLSGGSFTDINGDVLANGYLLFKLSEDATYYEARFEPPTTLGIAADYEVKILLDDTGNVPFTFPTVLSPLFANDSLTPPNTYYKVRAFSSNGQLVWGPNAQQLLGDTGGPDIPFDLNSWIPGQISTTNS